MSLTPQSNEGERVTQHGQPQAPAVAARDTNSSLSPTRTCCLLFIPYLFIFFLLIFTPDQSNKDNNHWNLQRLSLQSRRRLGAVAPGVQQQPGHNNNNEDEPFHPEDADFGIAADQPLPNVYVRRLAEMERGGPKKSLMSAPLYGGIFTYAYYFVFILVGSPPQRQSVIVDSGSSLLGFPCRNCIACGKGHLDKGFDFGRSETARWLSCREPQCASGSCSAGDLCSYYQGYSEGSSIEGNYFSDLVSLGEQTEHNQYVRFDHIGCHTKETNLFIGQKASGILGVSYPKYGRQETLVDALFRAPGVDTKVFSICASEDGGVITVGGFNSTMHRQGRTRNSETKRMLGVSQSLRFDKKLREKIFSENDDEAQIKFKGELKDEPVSRLRILLEEKTRRRLLEGGEQKASDDHTDAVKPENGQQHNVAFDEQMVNEASANIAWVPITTTTAYHVVVEEMAAIMESSGADNIGERIATKADLGQCAIDSGTTFTYLAPRAYEAFDKVLEKSCSTKTSAFCNSGGGQGFCWRITDTAMFGLLPSFLFTFRGGSVVEWKPNSYLHRRGSTDLWCAAVEKNQGGGPSILGMSFMKQKDVIFDRDRDLIGFVDADCPVTPLSSQPPPPVAPSKAAPTTPTTAGPSAAVTPTPGDRVGDFSGSHHKVDALGGDSGASTEASSGFSLSNSYVNSRTFSYGASGMLLGIVALGMAAVAIKRLNGNNGRNYEALDEETARAETAGHAQAAAEDRRSPSSVITDLEMGMYPDEDRIALTSILDDELSADYDEEEPEGDGETRSAGYVVANRAGVEG